MVKNNNDFVIVDLRIDVFSPNNFESFVSLRFVDVKPHFPKVKRTLDDFNKHPEAMIVDHSYTYKEITKDTDLNGLYFTKH